MTHVLQPPCSSFSLEKVFLDHRAKDEVGQLVGAKTHGATPLVMACRNGHYDVAEYLIEKCGADVEQPGSGESAILSLTALFGPMNHWCIRIFQSSSRRYETLARTRVHELSEKSKLRTRIRARDYYCCENQMFCINICFNYTEKNISLCNRMHIRRKLGIYDIFVIATEDIRLNICLRSGTIEVTIQSTE